MAKLIEEEIQDRSIIETYLRQFLLKQVGCSATYLFRTKIDKQVKREAALAHSILRYGGIRRINIIDSTNKEINGFSGTLLHYDTEKKLFCGVDAFHEIPNLSGNSAHLVR